MKKKLLAGLLILTFVITACGSGSGSSTDEAIAEVNGVKVSREYYSNILDLYANYLAANYGMSAQVKNMLIQDEVIRQDLKAQGIKVTDDDLKEYYEENIKAIGDDDAYQEMLFANNITDELYKLSLESNYYYQKHQEWYNEQNEPTEDEINEYYEENKDTLDVYDVSHILVATEEEAEDVIERINNGEAFEDVAKEVSLDSSASNGGSLGEATLENYVDEFAEGIKNTEVGSISEPVKSQYGFHIIKVNSSKIGVDDNKEAIVSSLDQSKYQDYLTELEDKAEIVDLTVKETEDDSDKDDSGKDDSGKDDSDKDETNQEETDNSDE